ncbi:hypothetical protein [Pararhodobacter sp. SW119]|uniref:hypothetical protein n=1 Tax=Pararhodobacter sp. SW119 TaxID=2780075 RepID=UPI001ADEF0E5|nr:hypothetical protein [Pararhodobacter sp. SW119]
MSYDLNDAAPQMAPMGELIPDGTFAKVMMKLRPGGTNGATPMDAGLLKVSPHSDAKMLDCEFTVIDGPFARRKFWQNFTVAGGKLDEKGQSKGWNISKSTFRAMVDSALGLDPNDVSQAAREKRVIGGLKQLDGITFAARIMVESSENPNYRDSNKIANVVLPIEPAHAAIMRGEQIAPEPVNAPPRKAPAQTPAAWSAPAHSGWASTPQAPATPAQPGAPSAAPATPGGAPAWLNS